MRIWVEDSKEICQLEMTYVRSSASHIRIHLAVGRRAPAIHTRAHTDTPAWSSGLHVGPTNRPYDVREGGRGAHVRVWEMLGPFGLLPWLHMLTFVYFMSDPFSTIYIFLLCVIISYLRKIEISRGKDEGLLWLVVALRVIVSFFSLSLSLHPHGPTEKLITKFFIIIRI